jgi:DNA-binding transcriptional ArsR family regulator
MYSVTTILPTFSSFSSAVAVDPVARVSLSNRWLINRSDKNGRKNGEMAVDELTETFAALADPTRRAILTRLADGEATVNELAEPFPITLQAVSKHLKVLERARLITRGRSAQLRPARLHGPPLAEAADWLERYRPFWQDSFERLDERLQASQPRTPR